MLEHPSTKAPFFAFLLPLFLVLLEQKQRFATTPVGFEPWFSAAEFFCWNYHLIVLEVTFFVATAFAFCYNQGSFLLHPCMAPESARNTGDDDSEGRQPAARGGNRRQGRGPARGGNRRQGRGRRQARSAMDVGCWSTHERRHEDEAVRPEDAASSGWA